jgi:hypothetical protein
MPFFIMTFLSAFELCSELFLSHRHLVLPLCSALVHQKSQTIAPNQWEHVEHAEELDVGSAFISWTILAGSLHSLKLNLLFCKVGLSTNLLVLSRQEALSLNPNTTIKKKKKQSYCLSKSSIIAFWILSLIYLFISNHTW